MTALRVTGPDPRMTRPSRSWGAAEERARRVALLVGSAEIQRRQRDGAWHTVERWAKVGSRVERMEAAR